MVECEEKLRSGSDLLVSLSVHIRPSAFKLYEASSSDSSAPKFWFNEGTETEHEEMLRERKTALRQLFERLDLKPRAGTNVVLDKENNAPSKQAKVNQPTQAGTSGDGNGDENDEEILSNNDLDVIYRRSI